MSGIILNCVGALGLILIITGVIAAFMFILGIGKVTVSGKNKLQYKIKGTEVQIGTGHVYFAIVLGLVLVITPFPISKYFGDVAKANAVDKATPIISKLKEGKYTISEEEIRIDLRNRKEIGIAGYLGSDLSETERRIKIVIKDVGSGIEEVNFLDATSVHSIAVIDKPKDAMWRRIEYESKEVVYNPFTNILRGKEFFKKLLARKGEMRTYYMTVPITEGSSQEIIYKLQFHNAFQGRDFEWAGKVLSADTDIITMHITFPEDKPFKSFETYKRAPGAKEIIQINNPETETSLANHILTWNIRNAKKGEIYYIKWQW
jgi:hypothetical protein